MKTKKHSSLIVVVSEDCIELGDNTMLLTCIKFHRHTFICRSKI